MERTPSDGAESPPGGASEREYMSTRTSGSNGGADEQPLPGGWEMIDDSEGEDYRARESFRHVETGQRVVVRKHRRPTQMRNPETSTADTGYQAVVQTDGSEARLSFALSAETVAKSDAREFMAEYLAGDFDVAAAETPMGDAPVEW